jgi:Family of unknown function (DUF5683)
MGQMVNGCIRIVMALALASLGLLHAQVPIDSVAPPSGKGSLKIQPDTTAKPAASGKTSLKVQSDSLAKRRSIVERNDDPVGIDKDSLRQARRRELLADHDPNKAVRRSLILPGWGQVYNRRIWKVPIIYAGLGTFGYRQFHKYRNEMFARYDPNTSLLPDPELADLDDGNVIAVREFHRKFRDMNIIFAALWYTLQAVDAYVDGHMAQFDVSDDLSMRLGPAVDFHPMNRRQMYTGFNLTLQLKK